MTDKGKAGNEKSQRKRRLPPQETAPSDNHTGKETRKGRDIRIVTAENSKKTPAVRILVNTNNANNLFLLPQKKDRKK